MIGRRAHRARKDATIAEALKRMDDAMTVMREERDTAREGWNDCEHRLVALQRFHHETDVINQRLVVRCRHLEQQIAELREQADTWRARSGQ